jgi:hypothetical protein
LLGGGIAGSAINHKHDGTRGHVPEPSVDLVSQETSNQTSTGKEINYAFFFSILFLMLRREIG